MQLTTNLKVNEDDRERLEPIVVANPWLYSISQIQTEWTTKHHKSLSPVIKLFFFFLNLNQSEQKRVVKNNASSPSSSTLRFFFF